MFCSSHHSPCIFLTDITIPFYNSINFTWFSSVLVCLQKWLSGKHTLGEGARLLVWKGHRTEGIKTSLFPYLFIFCISPSNHFNCSLTVTMQCQQINLCSEMLQIPHGNTRWILAPQDEMVWMIRCHESLYAVCRISLYTATTRKLEQTVQPVEKKTILFYPEQREITKCEGRESRGCRDARQGITGLWLKHPPEDQLRLQHWKKGLIMTFGKGLRVGTVHGPDTTGSVQVKVGLGA